MTLDELTVDTFRPRIGAAFHVAVGEEREMVAQLSAVVPWGDHTARGRAREPFTLVFHAAPDAHLPQRIYPIRTEGMEPLEIFLVPMGVDERGMRYEAVFT